MTRSTLHDLLRSRAGDPAVSVAAALREQAGDDIGTLAELAADGALSPRLRAVALLAVAIALAEHPDAAAPDAALDAVEDADTATAAIQAGLAPALTGVLRAAPCEGSLRATRRLIGRRCLAADVVGPHVAGLLLEAGDREGAVQAVARFLGPLLEAEPSASPPAALLATLELVEERWHAHPELAAEIDRALTAEHPDARARLARLRTPGEAHRAGHELDARRDALAHRFVAETVDETRTWPADLQTELHERVFGILPPLVLELRGARARAWARHWRRRVEEQAAEPATATSPADAAWLATLSRRRIEPIAVRPLAGPGDLERLARLMERLGPLALQLPWQATAKATA